MKKTKPNLKLLNLLNPSRKKRPGKKRRIFASAVLAGNLLFGKLRPDSDKPQNYSNPTVTHEKVISAQELNSLDDSRNSGQIVRTGNGTILEFQEEVSNASSNKILFEHNLHEPDEMILVKNDGILPGAEGFTPNNNPRRPSTWSTKNERPRDYCRSTPKIFKGLEIYQKDQKYDLSGNWMLDVVITGINAGLQNSTCRMSIEILCKKCRKRVMNLSVVKKDLMSYRLIRKSNRSSRRKIID